MSGGIAAFMSASCFSIMGTIAWSRTVRHFYATYCAGRVALNYGANTGKMLVRV